MSSVVYDCIILGGGASGLFAASMLTNITSGKANFKMSGKNGEDFVGMPSMEKGTPIVISQLTLKNIIEETIFSISANENNKMMTGELFEIKNNTLRVAALDGHRIAIRYCVLNDYYENKSVIVPGKTLSDISRIVAGDVAKTVDIYLGKNHILFSFEGTTVMSRLIDGEYFRIDQMITDNHETKLTFNRKELLDCIERSVILVRESDKKPLILDIKDSGVTLSLTSIIGSMKEELYAEKTGKDLLIGFNPRFLIDAFVIRVGILALFAFLLFSVLVIRLWQMQVVRSSDYEYKDRKQSARRIRIPAMRGEILARDGTLIVRNRPSFNVLFHPGEMTTERSRDRAAFISEIFPQVL